MTALSWGHRAVVVARRVVSAHVAGEGPDAPTAEHLRRHEVLGHLRSLVLIHEADPQAVAHVGGARVDLPLLAVQGDGKVAAVWDPELLVEPLLQLRRAVGQFIT